jgi:hypothetical protein
MKDEYKVIKSISIFPWNRFEVWVRGEVTVSDNSYPCHQADPDRTFVTTRCVYSARTEQKAHAFIDYWTNISEFKLGESNETI